MEQKRQPKIGIFTTFTSFNSEYSLCTVVEQHLDMLLKHGYEPVLFTLDSFTDSKKIMEGVDVRAVIPQLILEPYQQNNLVNFEADVTIAQKAMEEHMADIDVMLTHDIIFQNSFLPYNEAMRRAIKSTLSHVKWLHWMHSGPSTRPRMDGSPYDNLYTLPANSRLIYMNHTDKLRAAEMYAVPEHEVRVIYNPMDPRLLFGSHPLTKHLIDKYDLLSADVIDIYPLSTTRMGHAGKQIEKVIKLMGNVKKLGKTVRIVVCNAHANGEREKKAIESMYLLAGLEGIEKNELIFTSLEQVPNWEHGVPHEVIIDLFLLSNVFIFPTVSENCPLVLLEAMACKNLIVSNFNFPALREFTQEHALYFQFSSLVQNVNYAEGMDKYFEDAAKITISRLENDMALKAQERLRKTFNVEYIFKQQLEPAIKEIYYEI